MSFETVSLAAMSILLGWGVSNISIGLWHCKSKRPRHLAFWRMNFGWGVVNTLIAAFALRGLVLNPDRLLNPDYQRTQTIIVASNVLLDALYIIAGIWLYRKDKKRLDLQGYGAAIFAQGTFLLFFDVILAILLFFAN